MINYTHSDFIADICTTLDVRPSLADDPHNCATVCMERITELQDFKRGVLDVLALAESKYPPGELDRALIDACRAIRSLQNG